MLSSPGLKIAGVCNAFGVLVCRPLFATIDRTPNAQLRRAHCTGEIKEITASSDASVVPLLRFPTVAVVWLFVNSAFEASCHRHLSLASTASIYGVAEVDAKTSTSCSYISLHSA